MLITFTSKRQEADDIWSFDFLPAELFTWQAGQSLRIEIMGAYGPIEHRFSIAAPPSKGIITVTTRLSDSDYKESLAAMQPGAEAYAFGLEGDFTWRESTMPHIFIAGGIGITPFYAMLAERLHKNLPLAATLFYSSPSNSIAFKSLFAEWCKTHPELTADYYIGKRVTPADIVPIAPGRYIYISGPSKMAAALGDDLLAAGIPADRILRDEFTGRLNDA